MKHRFLYIMALLLFITVQASAMQIFVKTLTIPNTTGISSFHRATSADNRYYNLQGQRIEPAKKGLYINNGRKVVIK